MPSVSEHANDTAYARIPAGRHLALALLIFFFTIQSYPQEPANPPSVTFRTNANLVVLDAVVKDRNGKPVTSLTKDDFTVLEDGVPQTIASFESASSKGNPAAATGKSNNSPNSSAPVSPQALTILVLDELNSEVFDQAYGRNAIEKFLAKHGERLQQVLLIGRQTIDTRGKNRLHRRGNLQLI